jgi:CRP-like cAMP-binding protein
MEIIKIMEGCFLVKNGGESALVGCPSEIVKVLKIRGEQLPDTIVVPEELYQGGIMQADLEFPFFQSVFFMGRYFKNIKLKIVGSARNLARIKILLNLAIFGPDDELQGSWGIKKSEIDEQRKITDYLAFKKSTGEIVPLEDMVEFIEYKDGSAAVGNFTFTDKGDNFVDVRVDNDSRPIDLNIYERQKPPLPIGIDPKFKLQRPTFGLMSLSLCTSGFDLNGYTSGVVGYGNSMMFTIDGVAYMKDHLSAFGISTSEIKCCYFTHHHGDHSTVTDMIINGQRVMIIAPKQTFMCIATKIAYTIDWPVAKVLSMVAFTEAIPGKELNWYGVTFKYFRVVHTVPTFGIEIKMSDKRIMYGGDTVWGKKLIEAYNAAIISKELFDNVDAIPRKKADVIIMDAAGGPIHPEDTEIDVAIGLEQKENICVTHKSTLSENVTGLSLAYPGRQWILIPSKKIDLGDYNAIMNSPILTGISYEWKNAIVAQGVIENISPGRKVLRKGKPGKDFYIILSGAFEVLNGSNELITRLGSGDFFGEISIMENVPCTATIRARSRAKILKLPAQIFLTLIESTSLKHKLREIHQSRPILFNCGLAKELPPHVVNKLIEKMTKKTYSAGEVVIKQGEIGEDIYFVVDGRLSVLVEPDGMFGKQIARLYRNQFFGEMAAFGNGVRTATVKAEKDTTLLCLSKEDFKEIANEVPMFNYYFGKLIEERNKVQ